MDNYIIAHCPHKTFFNSHYFVKNHAIWVEDIILFIVS